LLPTSKYANQRKGLNEDLRSLDATRHLREGGGVGGVPDDWTGEHPDLLLSAPRPIQEEGDGLRGVESYYQRRVQMKCPICKVVMVWDTVGEVWKCEADKILVPASYVE
jgi:hypothetical protein